MDARSLVQAVVGLLLIALIIAVFNWFIPIPPVIMYAIAAVIGVSILIWVLRSFGLWGGPPAI